VATHHLAKIPVVRVGTLLEWPLYTRSLERDTALAEAEYRLSLEPVPVRASRTLYTIRISLGKAMDLTSWDLLQDLGLAEPDLMGDDRSKCQRIGAAVAWLAHDGLLVPSARSSGTNLVI
jgi:RES domain-containing protein